MQGREYSWPWMSLVSLCSQLTTSSQRWISLFLIAWNEDSQFSFGIWCLQKHLILICSYFVSVNTFWPISFLLYSFLSWGGNATMATHQLWPPLHGFNCLFRSKYNFQTNLQWISVAVQVTSASYCLMKLFVETLEFLLTLITASRGKLNTF